MRSHNVIAAAPEPALPEISLKPEVPRASPPDPLAPTIFHESWWLDIVTGGHYEVAEVRENGAVVGRLPYFPRSRLGLRYSIMPPMTHFLGPAVIEGEGNPPTRFLKRLHITRELIGQLPPASIYRYKCHRGITDTIAFQQENFISTVQFTYEVRPAPEDILWKGLRTKKRKKIRSAQAQVTLGHIDDPLEFFRFYDSNLKKKGVGNLCDETLCGRLIEACLARGRGRIYAARDKNNALLSAIFCIWDGATSFYFMSSRTEGVHNGVGSLLTWEAMKDAAARGLIFDFDGLNNASGVLFITEFGGVISPRFIVTRTSLIGGLALLARDMSCENRFFY